MALVAQADPEALSQLYDRYSRLIYSLACAIVGDEATAGEITLDVFVRVWQRAAQYRPERGRVSTWVTHIARHHAIDVLRRRQARAEHSLVSWEDVPPGALPTTDGPEPILELAARRQQVRTALVQLPAEQRQALALAYYQGLTHREIAQTLDQPLGTIKTRIRLAMQKLRHLLQAKSPPADKSEPPPGA